MPPENGTPRKRGFIDVDTLQRELAAEGNVVERVASFYHRSLPELHRTQNETRMACHFACGRTDVTGDRAISVKTRSNGAVFRCFHYGCTVRGNQRFTTGNSGDSQALSYAVHMAGGMFKGRQPGSVALEEWKTTITPSLVGVL